MKMLIALVVVLSMVTCLETRKVHEKSLLETVRCSDDLPPRDDFYFCRFTAPIVRLILQPSRTLKLIKESLANFISTFSMKEVAEAFLGAITLPISAVIHSPELIKMTIEEIEGDIIPDLKRELEYIERHWKNYPLDTFKGFVDFAILFAPYAVLQVTEGFFVALAQSGFAHCHEMFMIVYRIVFKVLFKIVDSIDNFGCTDIISQSSCTKVYQVFENIVVNPVISFVNGFMVLVEKVVVKVKQVVIPIVDKLTPSHLERYCRMVLAGEACANIFYYIKEIDKFGEEEVIKVRHLALHVIQWIKKHILTDIVVQKVGGAKVIKGF